jgi:hypothetical protein
MTRDELRTSLRQPYNRDNWTKFVRSVFGSHIRLESTARPIPADDESIKSIAQIGDVILDDGRNLTLIEVEVDDNVNLLRNRVSLRNRVARFIDQGERHGVLAVFSSSRPEYRFTFTAKETLFDETEGMVEKETATKRFTYVLGPGETCTTAAQRFECLSQKADNLSLDDVIDAFSVEKLNKEFFNSYKAHYAHFCDYLLGDSQQSNTYRIFGIPSTSSEDEQKKLEKPVRDFVKRLLGRIVFLHFLQKKGWMGCPADTDRWQDGDSAFLANYFDQTTDKAHFYSQKLVPLFFDALNTPNRPNGLFEPTGTRIPYLNGGLFERVVEDKGQLDFPEQLFADLLDFFAQYNFTIDENDPDDHEVGIDPEMLGHIFENLLEDNKDKGAYYTPKPIVHYMCQQSLIYYLLTHLEDTEEARSAIEYLVRSKQIGEGTQHAKFIRSNAARIEELLDRVKICDPAIGSGAFPIGLLQEIFWLKLTLDMTLNAPEQLANVKRAIIQNSIYGVDIDAGAVDIARLRFWLALVVDEDRPRPLPNLDYKIMQGDSLLESFEGIPLDNIANPTPSGGKEIAPEAQSEMDFASGQMKLTEQEKAAQITSLMEGYFSETSPGEKQRIHKEIDQFVLTHIYHNLSLESSRIEKELGVMRRDIERKKLNMPTWKIPKKDQTRLDKLSARIKEIGAQRKQLETLEQKAERPYFLWHLFFQDVFEQGGFDIVIANPPYVQISKNRFSKGIISAYKSFHSFNYKADIYQLFIESSFKYLKDFGVSCFISPTMWLTLENSKKLRQYIFDNGSIENIRIWGDGVFNEAIVSTQTCFIKKGDRANTFLVEDAKNSFIMTREDVFLTEHYSVDFKISPLHREIIKKISSHSKPLSDYLEISQGITPYDSYRGHTKETIKSRAFHAQEKLNELYGKWLNGKDLRRYSVSWSGEWLKYGEWLAAPRDHKFFTGSKLLFREVPGTGRRIQAALHEGTTYCGHAISPAIARDGFESDLQYLLSVINSILISWYAAIVCPNFSKDVFPKLNPSDIKKLPIPPASDEQKNRLSELAEAAANATRTGDTAALHAAEDEINQIVYQLFDLTPTEITLIEESLQASRPAKSQKGGLQEVVQDLLKEQPYVSFDTIREAAADADVLENDNVLRVYLHEAVEKGLIHDGGRGWFTRNSQPVKLDPEPVQEVQAILSERFPLLPFYVWSTQQLNPWMQHLFGKFVTFITVDADGAQELAEFLRDEGWQVYLNPTKSGTDFVIRDKTAVVRGVSRELDPDNEPTIETILDELLAENRRLGLMDSAELHTLAGNLINQHRLEVSKLFRLLGDRKLKPEDMVGYDFVNLFGKNNNIRED